ncbi:30S ribosomal protein S8 [Buchnera aphidicola (Nipponaphis monzeni)]|uniref:Small ribosomal subunit protein uS8 n=1 Tax=Buchnera aphidicola (Nipponaphis monzeni) TaxID=2495405 RepID=A0A455TAJ6_9GAMM|nr:30S ribosomal protein S8 [Buchnera aphidicola]BBI01387.1 30S ribosomal protein S8 [Buchnera aphidicola (Nipponaphis monzeni)]
MSMQDPISDMLTRIRNSQISNKIMVTMPSSRFKIAISRVLKEEGYILNYKICGKLKLQLILYLKYFSGKPVIENIKRISRPSLRVYKKRNNLPKVMAGMGVAILSTSKGVITDHHARKLCIGGEVICYVS